MDVGGAVVWAMKAIVVMGLTILLWPAAVLIGIALAGRWVWHRLTEKALAAL